MSAELLFGVLGLAVSRFLFRRFPTLPHGVQGEVASDLSIIIPARNEARTLPNLLNDLLNQTVSPLEIICVDDASTDDTASIAIAHGAKVVRAAQRPAGWLGKPWACACGANVAKGKHVLFIDADVRLAPDALAALLARYGRGEAVVSVQPYHRVGGGYEQLALIFNLIQLGSNGTTLSRQAPVGLFGPVVCIARTAYEQVGGFTSVRGSVVEDVAIGARLLQAGYPVRLFLGGDLIHFRMYRDGLASLVEGWTKNFAAGAVQSPIWLAAMIFLWVTGCAAVPLGLLLSIFTARWALCALFLLLYAVWLLELRRIGRKTGSFVPAMYGLYPLSLCLFLWVFLRSAVKRLLKQPVTWKGRKIPWR